MFELCGEGSIFRPHGPVIFIEFGGILSSIYHRLDREYHAWKHLGSAIAIRLMVDIGLFMKLYSYPVSRIFSYD